MISGNAEIKLFDIVKTFNLRDEGTITEIFRLKVWIKPVSVLAPPENENPIKRKGHFGDSCIHGRGLLRKGRLIS